MSEKEERKSIGILSCPGSFDYGLIFKKLFPKDRFQCEIFDCEKFEFPIRFEKFDGFIITGSSASAYDEADWVKELVCVTKRLIDEKYRVVGICFGHQIVAQALPKGNVAKNPNGWELGKCSFSLEESAALHLHSIVSRTTKRLSTKPKKDLSLLCVHADCVTSVPAGFKSLGGNKHTPIQGMLSNDLNVLTFQSHPEFDTKIVRACVESIVKKFGSIDLLTKGETKSMDEFHNTLNSTTTKVDDTYVRAILVGHFI